LAIGFGVNIQAANHVIHFTRTWNPAKEDQATDRAYRIGQTKEVSVYYPVVVADFITFDAKLDRLLDWKRGLSKDVLNGTGELNPTDFGDIEDVDGSTVFSNDLINPKELSALSPSAFEAFCTVLWASKGFSKTYRTPSCGDSGVDVVALKNNQGALIQCKTSSEDGKQLGWDAVKDVIAGTEIYKRRHPEILSFQRIAVTNQYFNESAHYHAKINDVELIDRDKLSKLLDKTPVKRMDLEKVLIANWE
jgi:Holliday junction resolvase